MTKKIEYTRLDLMGTGKPESERTDDERRLATIVFAPAYTRTFKGVTDAHEWESLERTFHTFRQQFITTMEADMLPRLARQLIKIDRDLTDACTGTGRDEIRGR